jgi:hypothetical protein
VTYGLLQRTVRYGHFVVAAFFVFASLSLTISSAADSAKSVLVLYGERLELPAVGAVQRGLDAALRADKKADLFSESLDFARFPTQYQWEELASHLKSRYAGRKFDLVVTVAGSALNFAP